MKKFLLFLLVIVCISIWSGMASATLILDRGLPTANLNSDAGSNRSNVAWADSDYISGDDFTLSGSGKYHVDTISVWITASDYSGLSLLLGEDASSLTTYSNYSVTSVTYSDGTTYQGSSKNYYDLYQIDFTIDANLMAGTEYFFFLDGSWASGLGPYLHASNSALSGSTQEGADGFTQWLDKETKSSILSWASTGGGTSGWGGGWDKDSDANIQVYGSAVPEPSTMLLLGVGMVGLVGTRRKLKK